MHPRFWPCDRIGEGRVSSVDLRLGTALWMVQPSLTFHPALGNPLQTLFSLVTHGGESLPVSGMNLPPPPHQRFCWHPAPDRSSLLCLLCTCPLLVKAVGTDFIIIFRLSMLDLVDEGSTWEEVVMLAKEIEKAGATIINTGIGWHEARIPTIATRVPRAGFAWVTEKLKKEVLMLVLPYACARPPVPQFDTESLPETRKDALH